MLNEEEIISMVLQDLRIDEDSLDRFDLQYLRQDLVRFLKQEIDEIEDRAYEEGENSRDSDVDEARDEGYDDGVSDMKEKIEDLIANEAQHSVDPEMREFWEKVDDEIGDILDKAERHLSW